MKPAFRIIPWLILLIPFAVLFYSYHSIAEQVLIARSFWGNEVTLAPKSLFTVFRVPLIELVCASAIEIMRSKLINTDYYPMWSILLYTVAFKSLLQAFEIISPLDSAHLFYYLTFGAVIGGIFLAFMKSGKFFSNLSRGKWDFRPWEKAALIMILIAYLGLAMVPILVFK